jgi:predicted nucleic acid-binding protein
MTSPIKCVVDASVCIKQFIPDSLASKTAQLFAHLANPDNQIFVPDLLYIESANALWRYIRAGQLTLARVQTYLARLKSFPLQVVSTAELMEEAVTIGETYGISAYDASYVALSHRVAAPMLTLDRRLVNSLASAPYDLRLFSDFSVPPLP